MATIYAVVKLITEEYTQFSCHVYSKQSSNLEKMRAYKEEIKSKNPNAQVVLVSRERAKEIKNDYLRWYQERGKKLFERRFPIGHYGKIATSEYRELMENRK